MGTGISPIAYLGMSLYHLFNVFLRSIDDSDLARAYQSAAADVRGDVRELIPEFFTCPEYDYLYFAVRDDGIHNI